MPITHAVQGGVLVITTVGPGLLDEVQAAWKLAAVDAVAHGTKSLLIDSSRAAPYETRGPDEMAELAVTLTTVFPSVEKCAILLASKLHYGLARQMKTHAEPRGGPVVRIFEDRAEAWAWLGGEPSTMGT